MIKSGDRVFPYYDMGKRGKVVKIHTVSVTTNMVGGTMSSLLIADIILEDGSVASYKVQDLMREE